MNKNILSGFLTFAVVAASASSAFAEGIKGPCAPVWEACSAQVGKGPQTHECVEKIKGGGAVDGVKVSDADAKACAAAPSHHHRKGKPADASSTPPSPGTN